MRRRGVAYVAVMGSLDIAVIELDTLAVSWINGVGAGPRHLVLSPDGRWLYATLNGAGVVAKIDPDSRRVWGPSPPAASPAAWTSPRTARRCTS